MARKEVLEFDDIIEKIMSKKEFKKLPRGDVELVYSFFDKPEYLVEERIKLTRDMLRKMYTAFSSDKLYNFKNRDVSWFLKKHISTKERIDFYKEVYERIFKGLNKKINVFDFGCGINGLSYHYFEDLGLDVNYIGTEPVGQLADLQNHYFEAKKFKAKS
jgi:hypothetical protein